MKSFEDDMLPGGISFISITSARDIQKCKYHTSSIIV